MNQQQQVCRKRSAFRQKIRKDHIDKILRQHRQQMYQQEKYLKKKIENLYQQNETKEINKFQLLTHHNNAITDDIQYPFVWNSIPFLNTKKLITNMVSEENIKLRSTPCQQLTMNQFRSYSQFEGYIEKVVELLPSSVYLLVILFNNHPPLVKQFIRYLFSLEYLQNGKVIHSDVNLNKSTNNHQWTIKFPNIQYRNLENFITKFSECNLPEFQNYLHILQYIFISLPDSSLLRLSLLNSTCSRVFARTHKFLEINKISQIDIYKGFFDYLVTLGDHIRSLKNVEITMVCDNIKDVFNRFENDDQTWDEKAYIRDVELQIFRAHQSQMLDSAVLVCNNIVCIGKYSTLRNNNKNQSEELTKANQTIQDLDIYYQNEQLKQMFITELLRCPATIKKISVFAISTSHDKQLEHILRFLINLTFTIEESQQIYTFIDSLIVLVMSLLGQHNEIIEKWPTVAILVLRLINNLIVSDHLCAQFVWRELVIVKSIQIFGFWVIAKKLENEQQALFKEKHHYLNENNNLHIAQRQPMKNRLIIRQPSPNVFIEFISTITNYIMILNSSTSPSHLSEISTYKKCFPAEQKKSTKIFQYNFVDNLSELIHRKYIHLIIIQSLDYVIHQDSEIIEKCLQALIVLTNYENNSDPQLSIHVSPYNKANIISQSLFLNKQTFQKILQTVNDRNNVTALCQSVLAIINNEEEQISMRLRIDEQHQKEKQLFQQYKKKYQNVYNGIDENNYQK